MPENSDANLTRTLFLQREAHLLNLEDIDEDDKNGMPMDESCWQEIDMHAAISHEQTADDSPITPKFPKQPVHKTKLSLYTCRICSVCLFRLN